MQGASQVAKVSYIAIPTLVALLAVKGVDLKELKVQDEELDREKELEKAYEEGD